MGSKAGRTALSALAALALLGAGCGGDDDDASTAAGASGAQEAPQGAPYDITVAEFIAELQPQKLQILKSFVADSEACEGVEADNSFVLLVSAAAIDADPDAQLPELVEDEC